MENQKAGDNSSGNDPDGNWSAGCWPMAPFESGRKPGVPLNLQGEDGDEYCRTQPRETWGWWKPGGVHGGKITPEPPEERPSGRVEPAAT